MKKFINLLLFLLCLSGFSISVFAQQNGDPTAACGAMGCMFFVWLLVILAIFAGFIALIVFIIKWIRKDAVSRGMPNADSIKWLGLLGLIGLLIYMMQRPDGRMPPSANKQ